MKITSYTLNDQFAKIHIDENSKYVKVILSFNLTLYPERSQNKNNKCAEVILSLNSTLYLKQILGQSQVTISIQNFAIDIKICDIVTSRGINLLYTPIEEMLADRLIKQLLHIKFLNFIKQLRME